MNWQIVRIILHHELRMLLRYRRTVILAVVLPLVTMPAIFITMRRGAPGDARKRRSDVDAGCQPAPRHV